MEIRAIIVDDEERGISTIQQLLSKYCTGVSVDGVAFNISEAEKLIKAKRPHVVFLDIEMPEGNGFELLEHFDSVDFDIVFVTAYQEYALKAIKFSALDYILKPVKIADIQYTVEKIKRKYVSGDNSSPEKYDFLKGIVNEPNPFKKIIISAMDGYYPVKLDEILYCKADDSYTHFYLLAGRHYIVSKHLGEFEELLSQHNFFRVHKSYLVNINHIERVKKGDGLMVTMSNKDEIPVASRKKDEFIERIKKLTPGG